MTVDLADSRQLVPGNWECCLWGRPCPVVADSVSCAVTGAVGWGLQPRALVLTAEPGPRGVPRGAVRTQAAAHFLSRRGQ